MPETYARYLGRLALCAAAAVLAGVIGDAAWGWAVLACALLLLLIQHVVQLEKLRKWAAGGLAASVPEGEGIWNTVFDVLYRRQRTETQHRMRLARMLVRSRQAGRALPYGLAILDREHHIVWANDTCESQLGISIARDRGQLITDLVRQPEFVDYLRRGEYARPLEVKSNRSEGTLLAVQFVPYAESQWLLLTRDITQASKLETMRRDFVANVSHELRTPLTVLVGFLETIRELKLDPERSRHYLGMMSDQSRRMQRIIDDLLMLSTLESAPEPGHDERVVMSALLARVRTDAELLSGGRHRISLADAASVDLLGSESELASAFGNLASNAVRYTPDGGEITMSWRKVGGAAEFAISDTGPGIAPEHIPRLTERFYRVDRSRSRETGGTGLGLAIVKHALARHQATLEIHSEPGKGSRFTAVFPPRRLASARPGAAVAGGAGNREPA